MCDNKEQKIKKMREYPIVKSNPLIQHLNQSKWRLSALEQNIIAFMCLRIIPNNPTAEVEFDKMQEFDIVEFARVVGILPIDANPHELSGIVYMRVKETLKALADKSMWLKDPANPNRETLVRWFIEVELNKGSGIIRTRFHSMMKPFLINLREFFTKYDSQYYFALDSTYAKGLYELLKSYQNFKPPFNIKLDTLKENLGANYKDFPSFRRRVLDVAEKQINQYTDIVIKYETVVPKGRKVESINFYITLKTGKIAAETRMALENKFGGKIKTKKMDERLKTWQNIEKAL